MRTDVKIGIAVGLFVIVVAVVYFVATDNGTPPSTDANQGYQTRRDADKDKTDDDKPGKAWEEPYQVREPEETRGRLPEEEPGDDDDDRVASRWGDDDGGLVDDEGPAGDGDGGGVIEPRVEDPLDGDDLADADDEGGFQGESDDSPYAPIDLGDDGDDGALTDLDSDDDDGGLGDGGFGEDDREPDTVSGEPGTYTVKKTDTTGFWGIAEDYYGHGKYYTLIRDANPNVSSTALRPGTKLTMPPKPKRTSSASKKYGKLLKTAQHGKVVETVTGKKYYIVKKGDNGFWGVSEAAYGSGKHYQKIMAANPDVDTAGLQPGMKLVIPDLDKTSSAGSSGRARSKDHGKIIEGATGQKYYVVKKGDRGFVSVAEAAWGNGNLWPAVRDANPTLNPRALQPGMKIKVPKKPKASELPLVRGTAPSEPVETDDDGDDARPDFSGRLD